MAGSGSRGVFNAALEVLDNAVITVSSLGEHVMSNLRTKHSYQTRHGYRLPSFGNVASEILAGVHTLPVVGAYSMPVCLYPPPHHVEPSRAV